VTRKKLIFVAALLALIVSVIAVYSLLPKRYSLAVRLAQTNIFWNDKEAFFFLNASTTGRTDNFLLDKLGKTHYGYLALFFGGGLRFVDSNLIAFHLMPSGELKQVPLPPQTASYGDWTLQDGKLQLTPAATGDSHFTGFRWDGEKFVSVLPQQVTQTKEDSTLGSDDDDEDASYPGFLSPAARKAFKDAGWHYKVLSGYETKGAQAILPLSIAKKSYQLTITKPPRPTRETDRFELLAGGISQVEISSDGQPAMNQILWSNLGWQPVSKREFDERVQRSGRTGNTSYPIWIWLAVILFLTIFKFAGWGYLLMKWLGVKNRVLNNMATAYSFPPASPAQYPQLDTAELERYTREFENLGFVRLLDFSLVANTAKPIPNFCRVFANKRNHCFAEVSQVFPPRKAPLPLRCSIQSCLQEDWTLGFSDRKPQAASSLIRRRKALGVSMPGASTYELLQGFLQMRDQICQDLGISYLQDDSLEAYFAKVQRSASDMRDAVKQKNFAMGISEFYYRKFALLKTKTEYVWLGDYPKQAELRKQGLTPRPT
jgi:hypothetical protein